MKCIFKWITLLQKFFSRIILHNVEIKILHKIVTKLCGSFCEMVVIFSRFFKGNGSLITLNKSIFKVLVHKIEQVTRFLKMYSTWSVCLIFNSLDCISEKVSKRRLTISICCTALCEYEIPLLSGKTLKLMCFQKNFSKKL